MAYQTRQALLRLRQEIGSPDLYVAQKLHYPLKSNVFEFFSAEQVDAIALAIWNIERGDGMIIGDQTGIGKGRIAAAIIRVMSAVWRRHSTTTASACAAT